MNFTTLPPPVYPDTKLHDLLCMIGSGLSVVGVVFTMVLYGHYRHLHSTNNLLFICGVLGFDLIACISYFSCIFFFDDPAVRFGQWHCDACGFMEQIYSFGEPCCMLLFWALIFCVVNGIEWFKIQNSSTVVLVVVVVAAIGVLSSSLALTLDAYVQDEQSWCWVGEKFLWFRILFCYLWTVLAL